MRGRTVVGLDVGTTKICCIVGEVGDEGLQIIGVGTHSSKGLKKGMVVDIDSTVESIRHAVRDAELMVDFDVNSSIVGIAGGHIKGFNAHGMITLKDRVVKDSDVRRVMDSAKAISLPPEREVVHIIPQEFIIDSQGGILHPVGMHGLKLEARVHIITGAVSAAQNLVKCCNRAGLNVVDIVLQSLASADAVLIPDEKELGVALVDIGGGTTDIAVFYGNSLRHTAEITIAGNHITNDIAAAFKITNSEAEILKKEYGCAKASLVKESEAIQGIKTASGTTTSILRKDIAKVIQDRVEEVLTLIKTELVHSGYYGILGSGVVLTGGTSLLEGIVELAEEIFELPVRRGIPMDISGLIEYVRNPIYATGVGLVMYASKNSRLAKPRFRIREGSFFRKIKDRMVAWFREFF